MWLPGWPGPRITHSANGQDYYRVGDKCNPCGETSFIDIMGKKTTKLASSLPNPEPTRPDTFPVHPSAGIAIAFVLVASALGIGIIEASSTQRSALQLANATSHAAGTRTGVAKIVICYVQVGRSSFHVSQRNAPHLPRTAPRLVSALPRYTPPVPP